MTCDVLYANLFQSNIEQIHRPPRTLKHLSIFSAHPKSPKSYITPRASETELPSFSVFRSRGFELGVYRKGGALYLYITNKNSKRVFASTINHCSVHVVIKVA